MPETMNYTPSPLSISERSTSTSSNPPAKLPKAKLSTLDRLKRLVPRKKQKTPKFPPSSWNVDGDGPENTAVSGVERDAAAVPLPETPAVTIEDIVMEGNTGNGPVPAIIPLENPETGGNVGIEEQPEPKTLAHRIQTLLSSMPRLYSLSTPPLTPIPSEPPEVQTSGDSPPKPPANSTFVTDSRLVSLLSSATIMNGSISKGRESVWAILDRMHPSPSHAAPPVLNSNLAANEGATGSGGSDIAAADGNSDVMLYGPLIPTSDSQVELARSEIVSIEEEEASGSVQDRLQNKGEGDKDWEKGKDKENSDTKVVREKVIWVPSTTKISLQTTWWGYRLYLPPPVLAVLNTKSFEAAKRAAIITTALKWLLDHVPTTMLPPQLKVAVVAARQLVPLLGYIGGFITWSWGTIKAFDRGHGVILSATWLLPIALIPGTWEESEVPRPPVSPLPNTTPGESTSG